MSVSYFGYRAVIGPPFEQDEEYLYEARRLISFKNYPVFDSALPSKLARQGFYYPGSGEDVVCCSCSQRTPILDIHVRTWYGDTIREAHLEGNPNCQFHSENIPLMGQNEELPELFNPAVSYMLQSVFATGVNLYNQGSDVESESTQANGTRKIEIPSTTCCSHDNHTKSGSAQLAISSPWSDEERVEYEHECGDLKFEQARRETFKYCEPLSLVRAAELAGSGFYYIRSEDKIRCCFCKGVLRNWRNEGHDPNTVHSGHFPTCPFVLGHDVGNVLLFQDARGLDPGTSCTSGDLCKATDKKSRNDTTDGESSRVANLLLLNEQKLRREIKFLKAQNTRLKEQKQCRICMDADINIVYLSCGHYCTCGNCAALIVAGPLCKCPICRALITRFVVVGLGTFETGFLDLQNI